MYFEKKVKSIQIMWELSNEYSSWFWHRSVPVGFPPMETSGSRYPWCIFTPAAVASCNVLTRQRTITGQMGCRYFCQCLAFFKVASKDPSVLEVTWNNSSAFPAPPAVLSRHHPQVWTPPGVFSCWCWSTGEVGVTEGCVFHSSFLDNWKVVLTRWDLEAKAEHPASYLEDSWKLPRPKTLQNQFILKGSRFLLWLLLFSNMVKNNQPETYLQRFTCAVNSKHKVSSSSCMTETLSPLNLPISSPPPPAQGNHHSAWWLVVARGGEIGKMGLAA